MNVLARFLRCSAAHCHGLSAQSSRPGSGGRLRHASVAASAGVALLGASVAWAQTYTVTITQGNNQSAEVGTDYAQPLSVHVTDSNGNPASVTVQLEQIPTGAAVIFAGGEDSITGQTDSNGNFSVSVSANTIAGLVEVNVFVASDPSQASFTLHNTAGPATQVKVSAPSSADTTIPIKCTVALDDQYGNLAEIYDVVELSSTDPAASLPKSIVLDSGSAGFLATMNTAGAQTITATDTNPANPFSGTSNTINVTQLPNFVITFNGDPPGDSSNCTVQKSPGAGSDPKCSLRDAILAASLGGGGAISFDSKAFNPQNGSAANTIVLTGGVLTIPNNTSIIGAYSGAGTGLSPVVTVSGNNASGVFQQVNSTDTSVITGIGIANGSIASGAKNGTAGGAGMSAQGIFYLNDSVVEGNMATTTDATGTSAGAGIVNWGTMTLNGDLITGNVSTSAGTAEGGGAYNGSNGLLGIFNSVLTKNQAAATGSGASALGGGIYNAGGVVYGVTLGQSTLALNSATGPADGSGKAQGGGLFNAGTFFLSYSTVAQNSASGGGTGWGGGVANGSGLFWNETTLSANSADSGGGIYNKGGEFPANSILSGNTAGSSADLLEAGQTFDNGGNLIGVSGISLAPLGNYGGPTPTMIPMPGSPAICGGQVGNIGGFQTGDQRGFPNINNSYLNVPCADSGSVQTDFGLSFSTEPPPNVGENATFHAAVTLEESSGPFAPAVQIPLTLSAGSGTLTGGTATTSNGVANYTLSVSGAGTGDTLEAALVLNGAQSVSLDASSSEFDVALPAAATPTFNPPAGTYPSAQTVTLSDATPDATIYYTTNGAAPTTGSSVSSGPITVSSSETIKAMATASGYSNSAIASATYTITLITPVITWATPAPISYGTALSSAQLDATTSVPGTFVYIPAAGTILGAGMQTLSVTFTPTDTSHYTTATGDVSLTVNPASPSINLTSSQNPQALGQSVTFTATVSSTAGTPTGMVTFSDGNTSLGSENLASGMASYTTSSLGAGAHSITAQYSGDANFSSVTSQALSQSVEQFGIGPATGSSTTASGTPGGSATFQLSVIPPATGSVSFSVTGMPTGFTDTFSPSTVPGGTGPASVTLTIQIPAKESSRSEPARPGFLRGSPVALGLLLLPLLGLGARRRGRLLFAAVLAVAGLMATAGMSGCSHSSATPPGTYPLTVSAIAGSQTQTTMLTLVVK